MPTDRLRGAFGPFGNVKADPLAREREDELHEKISRGRHARDELAAHPRLGPNKRNELRKVIRSGRHAEEELLAGTYALVRYRVTSLGFPFDQDELEGAGLEGLVTALQRFDPDRGVRFSTYANHWIAKMVYGAISRRLPYPEADLRAVIKLRRTQSQHPERSMTTTDVARLLECTRTRAGHVMRLSAEIARGTAPIAPEMAAPSSQDGDAGWIIEHLHDVLGDDFTDFWLWTGRVMSLDELGKRRNVTKQAMAKRVQKWRKLVEASPRAPEMLEWLRAQ
jgi:RNA polymerase sigma factor (sigma-70 family)